MKQLQKQDLSKLQYSEKYLLDQKTGNIIPISNKAAIQVELGINEMIKQRQTHLISQSIMDRKDVEALIKRNKKQVETEIDTNEEIEVKRPGRKPSKK